MYPLVSSPDTTNQALEHLCPTCGCSASHHIDSATTGTRASPLMGSPSPLSAPTPQSSGSPEIKLRAQVQDITRALVLGDLSQKVEIQVDGEMATLKEAVNKMVDQLTTVSSEVIRITVEVGKDGTMGGQAIVPHAHGTWADLILNVNNMVASMTNQVRLITAVTKAFVVGDLIQTADTNVKREMLDLTITVNAMVRHLALLAQEVHICLELLLYVTRVSLEVGTEGGLGGQAVVDSVEGTWKILTDNEYQIHAAMCLRLLSTFAPSRSTRWYVLYTSVESVCISDTSADAEQAMNQTNLVRSIAEVTKAVTQGDLSKKIKVDGHREILKLKEIVNDMTEGLRVFIDDITRVVREVGTEGRIGAQALIPNVGGTWKENSEMDLLKKEVNHMVLSLRETIQKNDAAREAAELANKLKNEFWMNMSQEIRTRMNGIVEAMELTLRPDNDLTRPQRESLFIVRSLARSLLLITDDLFDISRSQMKMEKVSYSLRSIMFDVLKTLFVRADNNNIDVHLHVDPHVPDQVIGDRFKLRHVVKNLVENSITFSPSNTSRSGIVTLSCRLLALENEDVKLEFCVSDTGIGIFKDNLNFIFDTYQAGDAHPYVSSTTREYGGPRLGLSVTLRLFSIMQGHMWVESEPGQGSKFYFTIKSQVPALSLQEVLERMAPFSDRTILYVDTSRIASLVQSMGKLHIIHDIPSVSDHELCPHVDTILLDSLDIIGPLREVEPLRFTQIVLLSLVNANDRLHR
ncbi:hypothetical protein K439DRAFT_1622216 [Ramaria rubella]|nr:hypothetical protein K439DRAFT_1622216 [Ramaria rubella]